MTHYIEGSWQRGVILGVVKAHVQAYTSLPVYVEIGVRTCETIKDVAPYCRESHGVDSDPSCESHLPSGSRFWCMTSNEFFGQYDGKADFIFIDADHSALAVGRDFNSAVDILADKGVIFLHDTYPFKEGVPGRFPGCGGAWLVAKEIDDDPSFKSFTIPRFPGLTLVSRA